MKTKMPTKKMTKRIKYEESGRLLEVGDEKINETDAAEEEAEDEDEEQDADGEEKDEEEDEESASF